MSDPLVEATRLGRIFPQGGSTIAALVSATFRIMPGERIAIVGPSGCGKSTLLHLIGGLDNPTSGTIVWPALGRAEDLRPQQVALVFQAPSLLPPLTVIENVELPLLLGREPSEARAAAEVALALFGLTDLKSKLPEELSGGQAQRVSLARALSARPRLLLADEPTGQLDRATAMPMIDALLRSIDHTTALVIATHDLAVAERMDSIRRMRHGVLETAAELAVNT